MKNLFRLFAVLLLTAPTLRAQTDLIARIHFLGGDKISVDANSRAFTNEFCSAQARAVENQTLDKLAKYFAVQFKSANGEAQLRPLLDDLLKSEWILEVSDETNGAAFWFSIQLDDARTKAWQKDFPAIFSEWCKPMRDETGNISRKNYLESVSTVLTISEGLPQFEKNKWLIFYFGHHAANPDDLRAAFKKTESAGISWLSVNANWPRLAQLFPSLREFDFPKLAFQVIGREGNLRINGNLNLSQPLPALETWRVPTNALHQPFISFTAARGVGPWLSKQSWFQPYALQPQPGQLFVWALPGISFQTFAAEPVPDANAALTQLYRNLSANENWRNGFSMPISMTLTNFRFVPRILNSNHQMVKLPAQTNNEIIFSGIPFAAPGIHAEREPDGEFLVGGFFPNTPLSKPLPPDLFTQLATPTLVYYHWEITAERLRVLPQVSQLWLMITKHNQLNGQSAASKWLAHFGPTMGNSVTEAREISPTEISFTRKSPAGLTAVELVALANWLESPKFPAFDLRAPPRPMRARPRPQMPLMSVPPTAAPVKK